MFSLVYNEDCLNLANKSDTHLRLSGRRRVQIMSTPPKFTVYVARAGSTNDT